MSGITNEMAKWLKKPLIEVRYEIYLELGYHPRLAWAKAKMDTIRN